MTFLLLMYFAPVLAVALYWRAQRSLGGESVWETLGSAIEGRTALLRPAGSALVFAATVVGLSVGLPGALAFLLGVALPAIAAAIAYSASDPARESAASGAVAAWQESSGIAQALAAATIGCLGAIAWFFADPAGAVVLAAFAAGVSASALFLAMTMGMLADGAPRCAVASAATAGMGSHLPAIAAVLIVAATAEPESLLSLGGLLAETETLRSELMLLPIAVAILSPFVALASAPMVTSLLQRGRGSSFFEAERVAAVIASLVVLALVTASGLAWAVAAAIVVGVAARQAAVLVDQFSAGSRRAMAIGRPSVLPALMAAAALACGELLAGWYGLTLAALGMTVTFVTVSARATAAVLAAPASPPATADSDLDLAEATASVATALALLVAAAPLVVAESAQRGVVLILVATAAPALLAGVMAGAISAAMVSWRFASPADESGAVIAASRAVAIAAGAPALAGLLLGAGAVVGVALGFLAWSAASAPVVRGEDPTKSPGERLPRAVLLAWGRTMAIAAMVGTPLSI